MEYVDDIDESDLQFLIFDEESEEMEAMDVDANEVKPFLEEEGVEIEPEIFGDDMPAGASGASYVTEQICLSTSKVVRRYATPAEAACEMRLPNILGSLMRRSAMAQRAGFGWRYCKDESVHVEGIQPTHRFAFK